MTGKRGKKYKKMPSAAAGNCDDGRLFSEQYLQIGSEDRFFGGAGGEGERGKDAAFMIPERTVGSDGDILRNSWRRAVIRVPPGPAADGEFLFFQECRDKADLKRNGKFQRFARLRRAA